jgi:hypothetical protein
MRAGTPISTVGGCLHQQRSHYIHQRSSQGRYEVKRPSRIPHQDQLPHLPLEVHSALSEERCVWWACVMERYTGDSRYQGSEMAKTPYSVKSFITVTIWWRQPQTSNPYIEVIPYNGPLWRGVTCTT